MDKITSSTVVLGILTVINLNSLIILTWRWEWQWEGSKTSNDQLRSSVDQLLLINERHSMQIRTLEKMAGLWSTEDEAPKINSM